MKIKLKVAKLIKYSCVLVVALSSFLEVKSQDTVLTAYNNQAEIKAKRSVTLKDGFYIPSGRTVWIHISGMSFERCDQFLSLPSVNQNFISTKTFKKPGVLTDDDTKRDGLKTCEVSQTIEYLDGLGRSLQTVTTQGSPGLKDMIQPFAYDALGRESVKYQPYAVTSNGGAFRTDALASGAGQQLFYNTAT
ncbi:DUF6443 domain-containing protein, partial [Pedobacter sp.]|uniref:DUF6443 domain-containing protein n=1 Tax=Pedobacter sp. TaxID=1411316 RepID=UPI002CE8C9ED